MRRRTTFGSLSAARRVPLLLAALAAAVACGAASRLATYPDPVGDQEVEPGCGDIRGLTVSDSRGVITLGVEIRSLRCLGVVLLDTNRDRHIDYSILFRRTMTSRASVDEVSHWAVDDTLSAARSKLSSASRRGDRYTFRFRAAAVGVKRAFGFEAHIDGRFMPDVADWAPADHEGWFTYRLTGR